MQGSTTSWSLQMRQIEPHSGGLRGIRDIRHIYGEELKAGVLHVRTISEVRTGTTLSRSSSQSLGKWSRDKAAACSTWAFFALCVASTAKSTRDIGDVAYFSDRGIEGTRR